MISNWKAKVKTVKSEGDCRLVDHLTVKPIGHGSVLTACEETQGFRKAFRLCYRATEQTKRACRMLRI